MRCHHKYVNKTWIQNDVLYEQQVCIICGVSALPVKIPEEQILAAIYELLAPPEPIDLPQKG